VVASGSGLSVLTAFALSPLAYAATNIDNLIVLSSLAAGRARRQDVVTGFMAASAVVLLVASTAVFIENLLPARFLAQLGFVPIGIGLYLLLTTRRAGGPGPGKQTSWSAIAGVLLANSTDTIFVFAPLFAESHDRARVGLALGFVAITGIWLLLIVNLASRIARSRRLGPLSYRIAPWMMILVGIYILLDTATDVV